MAKILDITIFQYLFQGLRKAKHNKVKKQGEGGCSRKTKAIFVPLKKNKHSNLILYKTTIYYQRSIYSKQPRYLALSSVLKVVCPHLWLAAIQALATLIKTRKSKFRESNSYKPIVYTCYKPTLKISCSVNVSTDTYNLYQTIHSVNCNVINN